MTSSKRNVPFWCAGMLSWRNEQFIKVISRAPLTYIVDVNGRWSYFCYLLRSSNKQIIFMCLALRVCFVEWLPQNDRFFIVVSFIAMCRKWKCYVWIGPSLSANPVSKVDNMDESEWKYLQTSLMHNALLPRKQAISEQDAAEFLPDKKPQCGERGKVWLMGGWEWLLLPPTIPTLPTLLLSLHLTVANSSQCADGYFCAIFLPLLWPQSLKLVSIP